MNNVTTADSRFVLGMIENGERWRVSHKSLNCWLEEAWCCSSPDSGSYLLLVDARYQGLGIGLLSG